MTRSPIREKTIEIGSDNGAVIVSVAQGEQIHLSFSVDWLSDLSGYTIAAKVVEALNLPGDGIEPPFEEEPTPVVTDLVIIDATVSDNQFKVVIPQDLADTWAQQPTPDDPTYGFFAISIADTGVGSAQQIFVPVRGLIEVRYNPLETV